MRLSSLLERMAGCGERIVGIRPLPEDDHPASILVPQLTFRARHLAKKLLKRGGIDGKNLNQARLRSETHF